MITVKNRGKYWLTHDPIIIMLADELETKSVKMIYKLILSEGSGKIHFVSGEKFNFSKDLISRAFRMYEVIAEQSYKEGTHLELNKGIREWICYMLPLGLPNKNNPEKSIYVINECITN